MSSEIPALPSTFQAEEEASFTDLLTTLRRRWKLIAATIALITIPSALYGFLHESRYTALSQVVIQSTPGLAINDQAKTLTPSEDSTIVATEVSLLLSRPLVVRTMDALNLFDDPEFQKNPSVLTWVWSGATSSPVAYSTQTPGSSGGNTAANPHIGEAGDFPEIFQPMSEARRVGLEIFYKLLNVQTISNSNVIEIAFSSKDAKKAATISNKIAELYVRDRLDNKINEALRANAWTIERLKSQKKLVLDAENRVAELLSARQFVPERGAILTTGDMEELNRQLLATTADLVKLDSKLAMVDNLRAKGGRLDTIDQVLASPVIAQLRMQELDLARQVAESVAVYGDRNPRTEVLRSYLSEVSSRVTEEVNRIIESMRNQRDSLSMQSQALQQRMLIVTDKYRSDNFAAVELNEAERDATAKRAMYEDLLRRGQQTSGMLGAQESGARIISAAEAPTQPSSLGWGSIAAVAFVLSGLLGAGLALMREQMDKKLRSQRQIEKSLQVPCIAFVPETKKGMAGAPQHTYLLRNPRSAYAQSIRGICTQLDLAYPKARAVLITSALPNEGKTRLAVDIAVCAAQQGQRTVLVDFDDYRPMVAHNLGVEISADASNLFSANNNAVVNLDHALVLDQTTGVDILPVGNRSQDGLSMRGSQQVDALFKALRKRYQLIVIDSPPLLGVSDGRVLAKHADATILAVRWGETDRDAAVAAMQILRNIAANVIGAVLTRVDIDKLAAYGEGFGQQQQFIEQYAK